MLIWCYISFAMVFLIAQCTFKIVNISQQRCPCIFFTKLLSSWFIFDLLLSHFNLLFSSETLIFLLLYLASVDNVFGCSQLNWPWHFRQCSVAPEHSHFPFMLLCWCCWSSLFSLFRLFTLRYNCSLMHKCPGTN